MIFRIWTEKIGALVLQYLPDTIQTFSNQSRKTVSNLIQNIKGDKAQIRSLVSNIRDFDFQANYSPALAMRYSPLNIEGVIEFFRDSSLRVNQFFSASSSISNVLNSMVSIFSSEIEKVEKDIQFLENFIDNYQFIAGEDDLFNFNYIENFDNDLNSNLYDLNKILLYDRDGINFSDNGNFNIDPVLSKISISNGKTFVNVLNNYSINSYITNYNREEFSSTDTGFDSVLNESQLDNWSVTVNSPYLITSQIPGISQDASYDVSNIRGAQSKIVMSFNAPYESDFIRITPNDSNGMQVVQVIVEGTSLITSQSTSSTIGEYISVPVLSSPIILNRSVDVLYPKMFVSKITFIFNQSKYTRSESTAINQEVNSKFLMKIIHSLREEQYNKPSKVQDMVYYYFKIANDSFKSRNNRKNHTEIYSSNYPSNQNMPFSAISNNVNSYTDDKIMDKITEIVDNKNNTAISNIVQSIVQHAIDARSNIFSSNVYRSTSNNSFGNKLININNDGIIPSKNDNSNMEMGFQKQDPEAPSVSSLDITKYLNTREVSNSYEYSFSLKNILLGNTIQAPQSKSCFISNKIETNGAPIAIKGIINKVTERKNLNYFNYDLKESGSYELSVSLKEIISSEEDWIPLASSNDLNVDSEVLFFNNLNSTTIRFVPLQETIKVYKNGMLENPNNWSYIENSNEVKYNTEVENTSIYVCSYAINKLVYNQSIIDLDSIQDSSYILQSYRSNGVPGEFFESTLSGNRVDLSRIPFIEDNFTNAYYNDIFGTVTTEENAGYSPVSIVFQDGSTAINLTNYTLNSFVKAPFYDTDSYLYYHNGKSIIFNKPVVSPFRVLYKYLPSNLRFRLIMRDNIPDQIANISIDNVIIKCKVKNLDSLSSKLLRLK